MRFPREVTGLQLVLKFNGTVEVNSVQSGPKCGFERLNRLHNDKNSLLCSSLVDMEMLIPFVLHKLITFINHCGLIPMKFMANIEKGSIPSLFEWRYKEMHMSIFVNGISTFPFLMCVDQCIWRIFIWCSQQNSHLVWSHLISSHVIFGLFSICWWVISFFFSCKKREKKLFCEFAKIPMFYICKKHWFAWRVCVCVGFIR